jgi:hypothetical protein
MTEIALKQWLTGEITLNPPSDLWKPAHSAHDVYPDLFENPSEYHWFYDSIKDVVKVNPIPVTVDRSNPHAEIG